MTYRRDVLEELHDLKVETARLLETHTEQWREASSEKVKDIAVNIKAFLSDFRDTITLEEEEIERAFAGRAATALVSALALGVMIGYVLRGRR